MRMTLEELIGYYLEELNSENHWTVIWKEHGTWQGEMLYLPPLENLDWLDASWLDTICSRDPQAIVIHRCDWEGEITAGQILSMYQEGLKVRQIPWFLNKYFHEAPEPLDSSMGLEACDQMHGLQNSETTAKKEESTRKCPGKKNKRVKL